MRKGLFALEGGRGDGGRTRLRLGPGWERSRACPNGLQLTNPLLELSAGAGMHCCKLLLHYCSLTTELASEAFLIQPGDWLLDPQRETALKCARGKPNPPVRPSRADPSTCACHWKSHSPPLNHWKAVSPRDHQQGAIETSRSVISKENLLLQSISPAHGALVPRAPEHPTPGSEQHPGRLGPPLPPTCEHC